MTPEKKVKNAVVKILKEYKVYYFFPATFGMGRSGGFDVYCSYGGYAIGIECKADATKKPTALQTRNAKDAYCIGGMSVLLIHKDNTHEIIDILRSIENGTYCRKKIWPS